MTRDILNMPAGREMDELVAERVMGWTLEEVTDPIMHETFMNYVDTETGRGMYRPEEWLPSTDIAAAWEVVEKMQGGLRFELRRIPSGFWAYFGEEMSAEANTAPLAISRAALLAVRGA
jgi:hypothetical protein